MPRLNAGVACSSVSPQGHGLMVEKDCAQFVILLKYLESRLAGNTCPRERKNGYSLD